LAVNVLKYTMNKVLKLALLLTWLSVTGAYSQENKKEEARQKGQQAVALMDDKHKYGEAIKLLEEARRLDPGNIAYSYEIAYAYNAKADYKKACGILEQLIVHPDIYPQVYRLLGNAYSNLGQRDKAIATYEAGLKKFPEAGALYQELGNISRDKKNYNRALAYYERGIKVDPGFPANYYWAAKIYCNSPEQIWGMIYGEVFMNMERGTDRTWEIGKLLFETYKNNLQIAGAATTVSGFSSTRYPFSSDVYEPLLSAALKGVETIDLASLHGIRSRFLQRYFAEKKYTTYPNILFDYQKEIADAGFLEAYDYWLLGKGSDQSFNQWKADNDELWKKFMNWFGQNKMVVDKDHFFHREQY